MGLSIIRKLCNWMATAILSLIAKKAVGKQLQMCRDNTGFEIPDFLTTCIESGLPKAAKAFHRSVINEAIYFSAYNSMFQVELWQGSKDSAIG